MIYMSDSNGNLIPVANDNQGNDGITMDLLWENSSESSDFSAQTISISNHILNDYKYFIFRVRHYYDVDSPGQRFNEIIFNNGDFQMIYSIYIPTSQYTQSTSWAGRSVSFSNNSITFGQGIIKSTQNTSNNEVNNGVAVPLKIYGIK